MFKLADLYNPDHHRRDNIFERFCVQALSVSLDRRRRATPRAAGAATETWTAGDESLMLSAKLHAK